MYACPKNKLDYIPIFVGNDHRHTQYSKTQPPRSKGMKKKCEEEILQSTMSIQ